MTFAWLKGHGTENDFVLLPDHDGTIHGALDAAFVARLCNRHRGIGADGVLRVIRSAALGVDDGTEWFMDYRNADGSISQMCGNGLRVFARHLAQEGLIDPNRPVRIGTRDGVKTATFEDDLISVDMGSPTDLGPSKIQVADDVWEATGVSTGNPHAVVFVDALSDAGTLITEPDYDAQIYPEGVNIEFVVWEAPGHLAMRVHERGSGETRSCGTGACAVGFAAALADDTSRPASYRVDVAGGTLRVTVQDDGRVFLAGPAEINARAEMEWLR